MGKTAFVLSMARNMAVVKKVPVAFFSLEMSSVQLVNRLIASETELGSEKIKSGNEWLERKARETKVEYQQAIRKEEFRQINQEIIEGSEKYNPHLVETTDIEFADGVFLEKE